MKGYHLQLNESIVFYSHEAFDIFYSIEAIPPE